MTATDPAWVAAILGPALRERCYPPADEPAVPGAASLVADDLNAGESPEFRACPPAGAEDTPAAGHRCDRSTKPRYRATLDGEMQRVS